MTYKLPSSAPGLSISLQLLGDARNSLIATWSTQVIALASYVEGRRYQERSSDNIGPVTWGTELG